MNRQKLVMRSGFLNKDESNYIKGIATVMILFHHIRANVTQLNGTILGKALTSFGYLGVSLFLFVTGYGLSKSVVTHKNYVSLHLPIKIINLYKKYLVVVFVYFLWNVVFQQDMQCSEIILSFLWGKTIVKYGWYFQTIIVIYICYYISYKENTQKSIYKFLTFIVLYILICIFLKKPTTYYEALPALLAGLRISEHENSVKFKRTNKALFAIMSLETGLILVGAVQRFPITACISKSISAGLFAPLVIHLLHNYKVLYEKCPFKKYLNYLGRHSLELYAVQGIAIHFWSIMNIGYGIYVTLSITSTVLLAILLSRAFASLNLEDLYRKR